MKRICCRGSESGGAAVINRDFFSAGFGGLSTVGIGTCSVGARKITQRSSCILYKLQGYRSGEFA